MKVRLNPERTGKIIRDMAWALVAGIGIDFAAIIILFATGP